jgi:hypothetical protein
MTAGERTMELISGSTVTTGASVELISSLIWGKADRSLGSSVSRPTLPASLGVLGDFGDFGDFGGFRDLLYALFVACSVISAALSLEARGCKALD